MNCQCWNRSWDERKSVVWYRLSHCLLLSNVCCFPTYQGPRKEDWDSRRMGLEHRYVLFSFLYYFATIYNLPTGTRTRWTTTTTSSNTRNDGCGGSTIPPAWHRVTLASTTTTTTTTSTTTASKSNVATTTRTITESARPQTRRLGPKWVYFLFIYTN